jgi:hypothetical protein
MGLLPVPKRLPARAAHRQAGDPRRPAARVRQALEPSGRSLAPRPGRVPRKLLRVR